MESKLKELRELIFKCEEVKKDVLELKFGCKLIDKFDYEDYIGYENRIYSTYGDGMEIYIDIDECKIIGRDITLEDVLRVIEFKKPTIKITDPDSIDYGQVVDIADEEKIRIMEMWQLGKPLQFQSEECINSLIKLLTIKRL